MISHHKKEKASQKMKVGKFLMSNFEDIKSYKQDLHHSEQSYIDIWENKEHL